MPYDCGLMCVVVTVTIPLSASSVWAFLKNSKQTSFCGGALGGFCRYIMIVWQLRSEKAINQIKYVSERWKFCELIGWPLHKLSRTCRRPLTDAQRSRPSLGRRQRQSERLWAMSLQPRRQIPGVQSTNLTFPNFVSFSAFSYCAISFLFTHSLHHIYLGTLEGPFISEWRTYHRSVIVSRMAVPGSIKFIFVMQKTFSCFLVWLS